MNFEEAYKELLNGKKIRRREWEKSMFVMVINGCLQGYRAHISHFIPSGEMFFIDDWIIVGGDGTKLSFPQMIDALQNNKCITREAMIDDFIFIDNNAMALSTIVEYDFQPDYKCLCATDWEVIE